MVYFDENTGNELLYKFYDDLYGMPKAAYDSGAVEYQEKLEDVARRAYAVLNKM